MKALIENRDPIEIGFNTGKQNQFILVMKKIWKAIRNYFRKDCCKV